jgi:alpha-aminoadipic semialdehyde synthase
MLKQHATKLKLKPRSHSKSARGRAFSSSAPARTVTVGVRREDPARVWERRCPLTPDAAHELVRHGARVLVQPCERRVFDVREFVEVRPLLSPFRPTYIPLFVSAPRVPVSALVRDPKVKCVY